LKKESFASSVRKVVTQPVAAVRKVQWLWRGVNHAASVRIPLSESAYREQPNDLQNYFDAVESGPGIYKWQHYFEIYDRHFQRFRGQDVHVLEIGIYSGGSLGMWQSYFGPRCHVYGVDIEPSCRVYERDGIKIFIGDQADRAFWKNFHEQVPHLDIVIDDGGHEVAQQVMTLEETLPRLRAGGVYLCEDIHGTFNNFALYMSGLSWSLNDGVLQFGSEVERNATAQTSSFQSAIHSIHLYPFVAVIEVRHAPVTEFVAAKHGSEWQPFLR
jgi:hypothetical protein